MNTEDDRALRPLTAILRGVCAELPGSEEYVMVHHPAFRVGKKPFAIVGLHNQRDAAALSINFGLDEQALLLDDARFSRTPYIGQHGWVTIAQTDLRAGELASLVTDSWRRVASKRQLAEHDAASQSASTSPLEKKPQAARLAKVKARTSEQRPASKRRANVR
jgi:predicted DNA-binding protein (MmcQ/YjbR family)